MKARIEKYQELQENAPDVVDACAFLLYVGISVFSNMVPCVSVCMLK